MNTVGIARTPDGEGYWLVSAPGVVRPFGSAAAYGNAPANLNQPIVGIAATPTGRGYWLTAGDGGVFCFGDAGFFGSMAGIALNAPVAAIDGTASGQGYWLTAGDGGVFTFGDAGFFGSSAGTVLNGPVVGVAGTASTQGYWLGATDGGVFTFGDAGFFGSSAGQPLNAPVVGITRTPSGQGYWLVASDGGIFTQGDAGFFGSLGGQALNQPIVGMAATPTGQGYWLADADGEVFAFGDAQFLGSDLRQPPTVALPSFLPTAGTYSNLVLVLLSTTTPGASLYYTTDGSDPDAQNPPANATRFLPPHPIVVTQNQSIRARAFKPGWQPSAVAVADYTIQNQAAWPPPCNFDVYNVPAPVQAADAPNNTLPSLQVPLQNLDSPAILHVIPPQSDPDPIVGTGTRADPFRSITQAMAALGASPNAEVLYLHLGPDPTRTAFKERVETSRPGSAQTPLWLYADPGVKMTAGGPASTAAFISVKHDYWIVEGVEIDGSGTQGVAVSVGDESRPDPAQPPIFTPVNHVLVRRVHAHDGQASQAIQFAGAQDAWLLNSEIHGYRPLPNAQDGHAILVYYSAARIWIEDNKCYNNDGDALQCQGPLDNSAPQDVPANSAPAQHVTIIGNDFHHNVENAVDLKSCTRATVRGNKFHDYGVGGSRSEKGTALVIHYNADEVLVEGNEIWNCGLAISVGNPQHPQVGAVVLRRNLIHDMTVLTNAQGDIDDTGSGLSISTARRVEIYHNTFVNLPRGSRTRNDGSTYPITSGYAVRLDENGGPVDQTTFVNNIVANVGLAFIKGQAQAALSCDRNLYFNPDSNPGSSSNPDPSPALNRNRPLFRVGNNDTYWSVWRTTYDCASPDPAADPLFVNAAGGDFRINVTSPARDRAIPVLINGVVEDFEGTRPDIGAKEWRP